MIIMDSFFAIVWKSVCRGEILFIGNSSNGRRWIEPPSRGNVLALAPHPDDPDSVAVTLRIFHEAGCKIRYVITGGAHGGVDDHYAIQKAMEKHKDPKNLNDFKAELRREEQIASAKMSGMLDDDVVFLDGGEEDELGDLRNTPHNAQLLQELLVAEDPDIVLLPYGEDTNNGHVALFELLGRVAPRVAADRNTPMMALYIRDPKTISINEQLVVPFDGEAARWKASLLRLHDSQQQRNIEVRGYGMDERILRLNHQIQTELQEKVMEPWKDECPYAESFQVELFG